MLFNVSASLSLWHAITRLGEAQILLPAALVAMVGLLRQRAGRPLALWWLGLLDVAAALTTVTKVAFIGWGIGSPTLDFTGISGHAMFAAAVYPLLLGTLAPDTPPHARLWAVAVGALLALAVGVSRVEVGAHSVSEVVAGLGLGGTASMLAMARHGVSRAAWNLWLPVGLALWLVALPAVAPPSQTHSMVTRLALALAGRDRPYERQDMFRRGPATRWSQSLPRL